MELLTAVQVRVFGKLNPAKIIELFKLGEGQPPQLGVRCADLVSGFYSFLGYTRLIDRSVLQRAVAQGVQQGIFGYIAGAVPALDADCKYKVARNKARFDVPTADDEIDLDSGFVMLPEAITAAPAPGPGPVPPGPTPTPPGPGPAPAGGPGVGPTPPPEKVVQLSITADRDQLYTAWNAIANLADLAGKVELNIRAESEKGFDKSKLQNGVFEPLREIELID
jgi:hypothetical protein